MVAVRPWRMASETKVGGRWHVDADGGRMQQRWNPRMRGVDGGEDSGGVRMQWRQRRGVDSGTLQCGKLDVNAFGECGKAKKFGKKGLAKGNFILQTCVAKTCL
jgi:hypothetical protein